MKKITINYLSHHRLNYTNLMFYFLKKIKNENKDILKINILATYENEWVKKCEELGIEYSIKIFKEGDLNYLNKIKVALDSSSEYSVKLDEDCFMNNYVWDYLIENVDVLNDDNILTLSPVMSNNIPSCDYFIEDFIDDKYIKSKIYNMFLGVNMPNGLWGANYEQLNFYTLNSKEWNPKNFYEGVKNLKTNTRGIHPLRISYDSQKEINDYIINNVERFINPNNYNLFEIDSPYFTNSLFFIKTSEWKKILSLPRKDTYDEISLNKYKTKKNKKFLFVKNGFGIHPMFNTVHGNKNPWGIGSEDAPQSEVDFYDKLSLKILSYDTLYR